MRSRQFQVHAELEQTHWWFTGRRKIVRALVEGLAPPSPETRVVEIGCGTGGNLAELATHYSCLGVDVDPEAIAWARRRFPKLKFVCVTVPHDVELELQQAAVVLLLDVLEHIRDDFQFLSQVLGAVRPGSYIVLTVPAGRELWSEHDVSFGHFRRYSRQRLEAAWQGLAVSCMLCSHFNSRLYRPIKWVRRVNRLFQRTWGQGGTDFAQPPEAINRWLHDIFSSERRELLESLAVAGPSAYQRGVSLVAVLRRDPGTILPRAKPLGVEPDFFEPDERGRDVQGDDRRAML
jgi:SAM-dependent methyltransferase